MKRSLFLISILLLGFALSCCSQKNIQQTGSAEKTGEIKADTIHGTNGPKEYKQRVVHPAPDQQKLDSLKRARGKGKII